VVLLFTTISYQHKASNGNPKKNSSKDANIQDYCLAVYHSLDIHVYW
jgi:hypothetical protein